MQQISAKMHPILVGCILLFTQISGNQNDNCENYESLYLKKGQTEFGSRNYDLVKFLSRSLSVLDNYRQLDFRIKSSSIYTTKGELCIGAGSLSRPFKKLEDNNENEFAQAVLLKKGSNFVIWSSSGFSKSTELKHALEQVYGQDSGK